MTFKKSNLDKPTASTILTALVSAGILIQPATVVAQSSNAIGQRETAVAPETNPPGDIRARGQWNSCSRSAPTMPERRVP